MTEHAAVIFVFFFLAEYASIVLICILNSILFLGGYIFNFIPMLNIIIELFDLDYSNIISYETYFSNPLVEGLLYGLTLGIKSCIMIFTFIWVRASFPRIRFDQLMSFC
jgi:NADH-ubiquinone oxidoreductase chain 1